MGGSLEMRPKPRGGAPALAEDSDLGWLYGSDPTRGHGESGRTGVPGDIAVPSASVANCYMRRRSSHLIPRSPFNFTLAPQVSGTKLDRMRQNDGCPPSPAAP